MAEPHKIFYKGSEYDFVIFTENPELIKKYRSGDTTIPLSDFISVFKVFVNRQGGVDGVLDEASKAELETEFGKSANVDDVIKLILEKGDDKKSAGSFRENFVA
ncbi:hypothetical protein EJF18_50225 [Clavispora lusitaniae]|uniref:Ribosome maturation protein SDO1/SBDS N-terminal domain-containing protein n=2 Tax=Clavispora lusitaniae TaxID=36911 RepID=C4Y8S7_CLAL4|nr:uncharacterized protein CLUG_04605 [Clavispora lusitaniae ATCC 42720]KAF5209572.1 hypothetical protein E0198_003874 [Clavispora lusitaniae]EEQ40477.1 hypothetical protein CLUG_04605 [Clavispora lusitaniae ATCC 42720]KAF7581594.1 Shwachman-Bodian-Diamond syndrome (SBDS) family protein [Clavispora lusitaniae]QFZ29005.1 hypothetical protein EJF14_50225 [Clavispora lusitaniae]QFZ34668.1 hypothetical protein EJF16_50225 [Clavispora lusitaniae]